MLDTVYVLSDILIWLMETISLYYFNTIYKSLNVF